LKIIEAYIDGATRGNQFDKNLGSWAVILKYGENIIEFGEVIENTTNNICEISAAIGALSKIKNKTVKTIVTSDSQYVISGVNEWSKKWKENGWRNAKKQPIENQGLWRWLLDLISQFDDITFEKCEAHSNNEWNNKVDAYCNKLLDEYKK
jgi:ribonuclease HI